MIRLRILSAVLAAAACTASPHGWNSPAGTAFHEPHQGCCGVITPAGNRLAEAIDAMHVEQLWQAKEHIDWETGLPDRPATYDGPGKSTHCSAFAAALGERLGVYLLRPPQHGQILLASAQAEWFHQKDGIDKGWKPLGGANPAQTAQELANQGMLVVIVYESPNPHTPGHIVIVRPSNKSAEALAREGPQIAQAGARNDSSYPAALAFVHHPGAWPDGVHFYWHPVDWAAIPPSSPKN
jgi:hypothetical protein